MTPIDLRIERLRKIENSKDISAIENLEVMIADIKDKGLENVRMTALLIHTKPDGSQALYPYNAGLDRAQEIGYLNVALKLSIEDFIA